MARSARRYSKRIQVWASVPTDDNYGGKTLTDGLVKTMWADVKTLDSSRSIENGLDVSRPSVEVYMRKDPGVDWANETLFLKINSIDYRISRIEEINLDGIEIRIIAVG